MCEGKRGQITRIQPYDQQNKWFLLEFAIRTSKDYEGPYIEHVPFIFFGGRGGGRVGVGEEVVDFNLFWDREEGGIPLVYDVKNEKINCNRKQAKEMTRKK